MEFLPWRDQVALSWKFARWAIWPPGMPLWGQLVYKAGQAAAIFGIIAGSWAVSGTATVLIMVLAWVTRQA